MPVCWSDVIFVKKRQNFKNKEISRVFIFKVAGN
jgi:hypothetical protein